MNEYHRILETRHPVRRDLGTEQLPAQKRRQSPHFNRNSQITSKQSDRSLTIKPQIRITKCRVNKLSDLRVAHFTEQAIVSNAKVRRRTHALPPSLQKAV